MEYFHHSKGGILRQMGLYGVVTLLDKAVWLSIAGGGRPLHGSHAGHGRVRKGTPRSDGAFRLLFLSFLPYEGRDRVEGTTFCPAADDH